MKCVAVHYVPFVRFFTMTELTRNDFIQALINCFKKHLPQGDETFIENVFICTLVCVYVWKSTYTGSFIHYVFLMYSISVLYSLSKSHINLFKTFFTYFKNMGSASFCFQWFLFQIQKILHEFRLTGNINVFLKMYAVPLIAFFFFKCSPLLISPLYSLWEEKQYLEKENEFQPKPAVSSSLHHSGEVSETWITTATAVFREDKYEFYFKPPSRLNPSKWRLATGTFWSHLKQCEAKKFYITISHLDKRMAYELKKTFNPCFV